MEEPIVERVTIVNGFLPHGRSPCQSGLHCITFLHHNIRGFISHKDELEVLLKIHSYPCFVGSMETFLDPSRHHPKLNGYVVVARKDRGGLRQKGGFFCFVRDDLLRYVFHLGNSSVAERLWIAFHSDQGPYLMGLWYRPPAHGEVASITSIPSEIEEFGNGMLGRFSLWRH